jgi:hypothetical protein
MRTSLLVLALASASLAWSLGGCGDDAAPGPVDLGPPDLSEVDMELPPAQLYEPCDRDSQCPGFGAVCRRPADGWPNGYCTVPCTPPDNEPCRDLDLYYHHCLTDSTTGLSWCERRCINGLDCARDGYTCVGEYPPTAAGMCVGICLRDADCGRGEVCDSQSGRCVVSVPTTGAAIGEACAANADCRSNNCIEQVDSSGNPSGFVGGYCTLLCILPTGYNTSSFFAGTALPQATCPSGGICYPNGGFTEGDPGVCLDECSAAGDCRPGLECVKDFSLSSGGVASFSNGVCLPIDCQATACPTGYSCQSFAASGRTYYRCGPV